MSWFSTLTEKSALAKTSGSGSGRTAEIYNKLSQHVPESFTLSELADSARESLKEAYAVKPKVERNQLVSLLCCLRCEDRIVRNEPTDQDAVKDLARNVANIIAPVIGRNETSFQGNDHPDAAGEDLAKANEIVLKQCQAVSGLGLEVLEVLIKQVEPVRLEDEVLYTLLAYTDETKPWGSPQTITTANRLLEQQFSIPGSSTKDQFLAEGVLQNFLPPLFSKSKPSSITASGRKAEYHTATRGESMPDDSPLTKPWKYTDLRAIPAVRWAVREADDQLIAKHWPLFIPVLLTLVDDSANHVTGLLLLSDFLAKFPDKTLQNTGLAQVFEDAVFPILSYLPSLTPESESVELLGPAYTALLRLANKQPLVGKDGIPGGPKNRLLDKMLREGVFMGYFHAKEHAKIVAVLCQQTAAILNEMGVHAVKHLKDLIPMLSSIMTDPFAPLAPATLLSAVKALQAVLANCWPRIPASPWQDEIINALVLCWLHLAEHDHPATDTVYSQIEQELLTSSRALAAVLKSAGRGGDEKEKDQATDLATHVAPLVAKDSRLAALFPSN